MTIERTNSVNFNFSLPEFKLRIWYWYAENEIECIIPVIEKYFEDKVNG